MTTVYIIAMPRTDGTMPLASKIWNNEIFYALDDAQNKLANILVRIGKISAPSIFEAQLDLVREL